MKTCTKCGEEKPLEAFGRAGKGDKRRSECKACHAAHVRARYHANPEESREANRERQRRYYAANPEKFKARSQAFRDAYPDKHLAWSVRWAENNPEKVREYKRRWDAANPEAKRDAVRKRRALRQKVFVAEVRFDEILRRDLGVCGICDKPIMENTLELDHVLPLAAGGWHAPDNVQLAHRACNRRKAARVGYTLADAA